MSLIDELQELMDKATDSIESLREWADPRGVLIETIRNLSPIIISHIYKIIVYSNNEKYKETAHHWASEVRACLVKFCKKQIKGRNKLIDVNLIVNTIKSKYINSGELQDIICECEELYPEVPLDNIDFDDVYNRVISTLEPLVSYVQSNIKPNISIIENIIREKAI